MELQWRAISDLAQARVRRIPRALFWQYKIGIFYTGLERISRTRSDQELRYFLSYRCRDTSNPAGPKGMAAYSKRRRGLGLQIPVLFSRQSAKKSLASQLITSLKQIKMRAPIINIQCSCVRRFLIGRPRVRAADVEIRDSREEVLVRPEP
jgi:hypothetical protein